MFYVLSPSFSIVLFMFWLVECSILAGLDVSTPMSFWRHQPLTTRGRRNQRLFTTTLQWIQTSSTFTGMAGIRSISKWYTGIPYMVYTCFILYIYIYILYTHKCLRHSFWMALKSIPELLSSGFKFRPSRDIWAVLDILADINFIQIFTFPTPKNKHIR